MSLTLNFTYFKREHFKHHMSRKLSDCEAVCLSQQLISVWCRKKKLTGNVNKLRNSRP